MLSLKGYKIAVTGASSGIGREVAIYLSGLGARLILIARNEEHLRQTHKMLEGRGHGLLSVDLANQTDLSGLFEQIMSDGQKLRGLVHSAGIIPTTPLQILTRARLRECMNINFMAFMELIRAYSKPENCLAGSIVGISSVAAVMPEKAQTAYAASKAAMNAAVSCLAMELCAQNIRVNTVMPGIVGAQNMDKILEENSVLRASVDRQLLGYISPRSVAQVCAFLLSEEARGISGRAVYADGGRLNR